MPAVQHAAILDLVERGVPRSGPAARITLPLMLALVFLTAALTMLPAWRLSTWTHELGHALAAVLIGARVASVGIGLGKPYVSGRIGGVMVYFAPGPGGRVALVPGPALRPFGGSVFYAGGIAANMAAAVTLGLAAAPGSGVGEIAGTVLWTLVGANVVAAFDNARPGELADGTVSDGLKVWRGLRGPTATPAFRGAFAAARRRLALAQAMGDTVEETVAREALAFQWAYLGDPAEARRARSPGVLDTSDSRMVEGVISRLWTNAILGEPTEPLRAALAPGLPAENIDRFEMVVDCYEGRRAEARAKVDRLLARGPGPGDHDAHELLLRCALADADPVAIDAAWTAWRKTNTSLLERFVLGEAVARFHAPRGERDRTVAAARVAYDAGVDLVLELPTGAAWDRVDGRLRTLARLAERTAPDTGGPPPTAPVCALYLDRSSEGGGNEGGVG